MKKQYSNIKNIIILSIISILFLIPFFIMIISSFSTSAAIKGNSIFSNISFNNLINNFNSLLKEKHFFRSLFNSLFISSVAAFISTIISSLAGYGYAIYGKNKKAKTLFVFSFFPILIPVFITVVPFFIIFNTLNLIDTYTAVIISTITLSFNIYLFKQNSKLMPMELIKLAKIDGLNDFKIYSSIYIPCMKPVFITALLLSFLEAWNSVLIPIVLIQSKEKITNSLFLNSFGTIWSSDYGLVMIALVVSLFPIIFTFVLFQKHFKSGINISD